jgi:hypothetical protein
VDLVNKWGEEFVEGWGAVALGGKSPRLATTEAEFKAIELECEVPF